MNLPVEFVSRMHQLLGSGTDDFLKSYEQPKAYGLRINPLKCGEDFSAKNLPFTLTPVAWAKEGFYAVPEEHPGRHPLHESGAYYIQEPSAMSVVSLLSPKPGDKICDICAAPGGKSTHIAGKLLGKGLLVSNEIIPGRAKILSQNLERFGVGNCIVCNEPPDRLAEHFPLFFDKVLADAPCSGEGMFRKDETAIREWSPEQVENCGKRQKMILESADQLLSPGGVMVYSTCTFAPEEDEQMIAWFLKTHPDYELEDWKIFLPEDCGLEGGRAGFLETDCSEIPEISNTLRLWPHKLCGEGHFAARLRKKGILQSEIVQADNIGKKNRPARKGRQSATKPDISDYLAFSGQFLSSRTETDRYTITSTLSQSDRYEYFGDELYLVPALMNSLQGLKIVRPGLHLGTRRKNRFEPAHALAMALKPTETTQHIDCSEKDALCYLRGEIISCAPEFKSWTLVCHRGLSLGWGKAANGALKNHYPKGLRIH